MYVKYCRVTPTITYLYFVLSKKKLQKKKFICSVLSKGDGYMLSHSPCILEIETLEGSGDETEVMG